MEELTVHISETKATRRDLDISIPRSRFEKFFGEKVKKYSKELRLNGFRKGNVPQRLIAERFKEPITNEALEALVNEVIKEVCDKNQIVPVSQAQVESLRNENNQPLTLKAWVEVDQPVDFTEYKNLGIILPPVLPATAQDVEQIITNYAENGGHDHDVQGPAAAGQIALGEYKAIHIGGQPTPLNENKKFRIVVGKDSLPEFNDAFVGAQAGQTLEISVNYPADYKVDFLAGKQAQYSIFVEKIIERHLAKIDDEYAQKLGLNSLEDWKRGIEAQINQERAQVAQQQASLEAVKTVLSRHPFEVPESQIQRFAEHIKEQKFGAKNKQISPEAESQLRADSEFEIKKMRLLDQIAQKENIKATQAEVDARIQDLADRYGMPFESIKSHLRESGRIQEIRQDVQYSKVLGFLCGAAF